MLNKGAVFKFGASSREYKVQPPSSEGLLLNAMQAFWEPVENTACDVFWKACSESIPGCNAASPVCGQLGGQLRLCWRGECR